MTASALIQLLQGVAPDTLVVVDTGGTLLHATAIQCTPGAVMLVAKHSQASAAGMAQYQEQRKDATNGSAVTGRGDREATVAERLDDLGWESARSAFILRLIADYFDCPSATHQTPLCAAPCEPVPAAEFSQEATGSP